MPSITSFCTFGCDDIVGSPSRVSLAASPNSNLMARAKAFANTFPGRAVQLEADYLGMNGIDASWLFGHFPGHPI